jgi:hypothetical protein
MAQAVKLSNHGRVVAIIRVQSSLCPFEGNGSALEGIISNMLASTVVKAA